jgi:hypothetical protein
MSNNYRALITLVIVGTLAFVFPVIPFVQGEEESGGTAGTEMFADTAGGFDWNEIHGFVIEEEGTKTDLEFNVTICESVKYTDKHRPSGHIFGELHGIHWDDSPEPSLMVSEEDFNEYSDDGSNLTVYVYGEYYDESIVDENERDRYAFKTVTINKPNNPPVAIAWVAEEGNWTGFNLTEETDVTFIVEDGDDITLWFDASASWDPDGEDVTDWKWDFDEDGSFGGPGETGENKSKILTTGKSYNFGLLVGDARGKSSEIIDFIIRVQSPERQPDLTVGEIEYENKNANKQNFEIGDHIIVQPKIDNVGQNDTKGEAFKVQILYSIDNGATYEDLTTIEVTDTISSGNFKLITYTWITDGFAEGQYKLKVIADTEDTILEEYEDNNENHTNLINLEEKPGGGVAELSIEFVTADKSKAYVNDDVNVTVSILNEGTGDANYVDIYYDINGVDQYFKTIDSILAGTNATEVFTFNGDAAYTYTLGFIIKDDGDQVGDKKTVQITVEKKIPDDPDDNNTDITGGDDESSGFIPGFEVIPVVAAAGVALLITTRKRRD